MRAWAASRSLGAASPPARTRGAQPGDRVFLRRPLWAGSLARQSIAPPAAAVRARTAGARRSRSRFRPRFLTAAAFRKSTRFPHVFTGHRMRSPSFAAASLATSWPPTVSRRRDPHVPPTSFTHCAGPSVRLRAPRDPSRRRGCITEAGPGGRVPSSRPVSLCSAGTPRSPGPRQGPQRDLRRRAPCRGRGCGRGRAQRADPDPRGRATEGRGTNSGRRLAPWRCSRLGAPKRGVCAAGASSSSGPPGPGQSGARRPPDSQRTAFSVYPSRQERFWNFPSSGAERPAASRSSPGAAPRAAATAAGPRARPAGPEAGTGFPGRPA